MLFFGNNFGKRHQIEKFLNKYCKRFRDYDTAGGTIFYKKPLTEYIDICFATADFLYQTIKSDCIGLFNDRDNLEKYLSMDTVICVHYDSNSQCHSFILIPFGEQCYMVQSVGRMIDASWKIMENSQIMESIRQLYSGVHADFFGYQDDGKLSLPSITVKFEVSKRKLINADLLPDLAPYEVSLHELRLKFEDEEKEFQKFAV
jgi:hypothetical protein